MNTPTWLRNLTISKVALVPAGANPDADILIVKAAEEDPRRERIISALAAKLRRAHPERLPDDRRALRMAAAIVDAMDEGEKVDEEMMAAMLNTFGVVAGREAEAEQRQRLRDAAEGYATAKASVAKAKSDVASLLRSARISKQLTQTALARAADISERCVKSHELGEAVPSPLVAHRLAAVLGFDLDKRNAFADLLQAARG